MGNTCRKVVDACPCCIVEREDNHRVQNKTLSPTAVAVIKENSRKKKSEKVGQKEGSSSLLFQLHKNTCALEYYEPVKLVGEGSISSIHLVRRRKERVDIPYKERVDIMQHASSKDVSNEQTDSSISNSSSGGSTQLFALKSIMKDHVENDKLLEEMRREINVLQHMDHPNIVKVYEGYERKRHIYLVMEFCSGGDLYEREPYTEEEAARIVKQILSAVAYMHRMNVVHRDIKFENIMFENKSPDAQIKIIDFGLATKYLSHEYNFLTEKVGTVYTMAPQVLQGVYTSACDLWSVGVVTYMLLSGDYPFWGKTRKQLVDKIMRCDYNFNDKVWDTVSQEAKDFVSSLIKMDPSKRPKAGMALKSSWLSMNFPPVDKQKPDACVMNKACYNLARYSKESRLKKVALMLIAHKSSTDEIVKLRELFEKYDENADGRISYKEFRQALSESKLTEDEIRSMFLDLDIKERGYISYTAFLAATLEMKGRIETERVSEVFEQFDRDNTGHISKDNIREILGGNISDELLQEILDEVDTDKDGKISFKEFLSLFNKKKMKAIDNACCDLCCPEEMSDDDKSDLVDENAIIPGGKHDPNQNPKYIYDFNTQTMRKYEESE